MRKEKQIGSSLETEVCIEAAPALYKELNTCKTAFKEWLIVSEVYIKPLNGTNSTGQAVKIHIQKARGEKCSRCWHYSKELNTEKICPKCIKNLL